MDDQNNEVTGDDASNSKPEPGVKEPPTWKHKQKLSFDKMADYLKMIKDRVEAVKDAERIKLQRLVGVRDSVRKR